MSVSTSGRRGFIGNTAWVGVGAAGVAAGLTPSEAEADKHRGSEEHKRALIFEEAAGDASQRARIRSQQEGTFSVVVVYGPGKGPGSVLEQKIRKGLVELGLPNDKLDIETHMTDLPFIIINAYAIGCPVGTKNGHVYMTPREFGGSSRKLVADYNTHKDLLAAKMGFKCSER